MQLRLFPRLALFAASAGTLLSAGCVRKQFFQPDARPDAVLAEPLPATADSVRGATAGRQYGRHGRLYNALVGRHHRSTWAAPVTVPILSLPKAVPGGLKPGAVGGGFNSTSLSLSAANGRGYVLRTVDKDPIRGTPKVLQGTFLVNALRDNVSATHPYAALVVPPLAQAVGVPHASPRLFYVRADDPAFQGDSLRLFRGQLAYLEERAAAQPGPAGRSAGKIMNSEAAFAAVYASPAHQLDQAALLQARLLDAWLGDWDRHVGQWNWAAQAPAKTGAAALVPLPKDRDMVFYRLDDGALGWLVGHVAIRHWTTFSTRYPNLKNLLSSGRYLDARGLNGLTRAQFQAAALAMQAQLPDVLVDKAVRQLPAAAFALEGPQIITALQARREGLPALADAFYEQLAREPLVGGTAKPERFEVQRYADSTVVTLLSLPTGVALKPTVIYKRTFFPLETRTIQLEGLGGKDVFVVKDHGASPVAKPRLRIYGGPDTDELQHSKSSRGVRYSKGNAPSKHAYDQPPKE